MNKFHIIFSGIILIILVNSCAIRKMNYISTEMNTGINFNNGNSIFISYINDDVLNKNALNKLKRFGGDSIFTLEEAYEKYLLPLGIDKKPTKEKLLFLNRKSNIEYLIYLKPYLSDLIKYKNNNGKSKIGVQLSVYSCSEAKRIVNNIVESHFVIALNNSELNTSLRSSNNVDINQLSYSVYTHIKVPITVLNSSLNYFGKHSIKRK